MEVDDTHDFSVSGGIIVHNCFDAVGHIITSMPTRPRLGKVTERIADPVARKVAKDIDKRHMKPRHRPLARRKR
jgi:hypothetical protein